MPDAGQASDGGSLIRCAALAPQRDVQKIQRLSSPVRIVDAEASMYPLVNSLWYTNPSLISSGQRIWKQIQNHTDEIAQDLEHVAYFARRPDMAHQLLAVSPQSPQAIALLVSEDLKYSQPRMRQWEEEYAKHGVVLKSLASRYLQIGQLVDAQRCLEAYVKLVPDQWGYSTLADLYKQQKDMDKWKQTLVESLEHEDFSLAHSTNQTAIARYHMSRGEWDEALVFADRAAMSGASAALTCASECHEALQHWEQSELLSRANAQRYENQRHEWFFWCRRTGHGDLEAARRMALKRTTELANDDRSDKNLLGAIYAIDGQAAKSRAAFRQSQENTGNPYAGVHAALLAEEANDPEGRDLALAEAVDQGNRYRTSNGGVDLVDIAMAKWLNNSYHQPVGTPPLLESLEALLNLKDRRDVANLAFFAGRYFYLRHENDLAQVSPAVPRYPCRHEVELHNGQRSAARAPRARAG